MRIPTLAGRWLTEGGLETTLTYRDGFDLPHFAAFDVLRRPGGRDALMRHYRRYLDLAERLAAGLILESATWRASADWGARLGYSTDELAAANRSLVHLVKDAREAYAAGSVRVLVAGCVGPRSDAYNPSLRMSAHEAEAYHRVQIEALASSGVDLVLASTLGDPAEARGIANAAASVGVPLVVSFTVETDGRLPGGSSLGDAVSEVDTGSDVPPAFYMVNCAHPRHVTPALREGEPWLSRLRGIRPNASEKSHAELDASTVLDEGDPEDLAREVEALQRRVPSLAVLGGCCGTDHRHVERIFRRCVEPTA